MDLEDIKRLVNDADSSTSATREEASDMMVFGRISQWDDNIGSSVQLEYRGQFDLIKPKRNGILSELWANPISINFKPEDGATVESAQVLNGMFRTDMILGEEAIETASQDQVDVGFGAFRFVTEYESNGDDMNNHQRIRPKQINEANNRVYFDSNSKTKDKSDARWCLIISTFTLEGWKDYAKENGIDYSANERPSTFKQPNTTNTWFWRDKSDEIKVGEFYHKEKKRTRVLIFEDPIGERMTVAQKDLKDQQEDLDAGGFIKVGEKFKETWTVNKYLVDGDKIITKKKIAGEFIPVIPFYGDWSFVEGREIWRGIYHDAQDPQRLHNFNMSYMADIVSQGPRQKPIIPEGMIQGKERYWIDSGADDNFPYKVVNEKSPITGLPYAPNSIGYTQPPQMPQAQAAMLQMTRQSVDDVTGSQMNADAMMNAQVTEGQIAAAQKSTNMETFLYQNNQALAMKQAGRVYASMAAEVYDVPREVSTTQEDGKEKSVQLMESSMNYETGEEETINDITKGRFEVYAATGPNYTSQRDQAKAEMAELYKNAAGTEEGQIALLTYLTLQEGPGYNDMRKWANDKLILQGIKEPDTDEEKQMIQQAQEQQAQQGQQPDANMMLGMAEMQNAENDKVKNEQSAANDNAKIQVDAFNAETKRIDVIASNELKQVDAAKKASEIRGNELDAVQKMTQAFMPRSQTVQ